MKINCGKQVQRLGEKEIDQHICKRIWHKYTKFLENWINYNAFALDKI